MTVADYLTRVSHREHLAWLRYLERDMNEPGKTEFYLMQIAAVIQGLFTRNIRFESYRLKFGKPRKPTVEEHKAMWFAALGLDPSLLTSPQEVKCE